VHALLSKLNHPDHAYSAERSRYCAPLSLRIRVLPGRRTPASSAILEHLLEAVELGGVREMREIAGVQQELRRVRQCVDARNRFAKRGRDVLVRGFLKPMWLSLIWTKFNVPGEAVRARSPCRSESAEAREVSTPALSDQSTPVPAQPCISKARRSMPCCCDRGRYGLSWESGLVGLDFQAQTRALAVEYSARARIFRRRREKNFLCARE